MTATLTRNTTIEDVQRHLNEAHARIGFQGRFSFTIDQSSAPAAGKGNGGCYVTHWYRPTPYAFEDCKAIGAGTLDDCIASLDRYVDGYAAIFTEEEVGRTLGLPEKPVNRR